VTFVRCRFGQGAAGAVRLCDGASAELRGVVVQGNGGDGVIAGLGARLLLHDVDLRENRGHGLLLGPSAVGIVEATRIEANSRSGIRVVGAAELRLSGSGIAHNGRVGIHLEDASRATLVGCTVQGNGDQGVLHCATAGTGARSASMFRSCLLADNGAEGLLAFGPVTTALADCRTAENLGGPFRAFGGAELTVTGGRFERGGGSTARVGRGGSADIRDAVFTGSRLALAIGPGARVHLHGNTWPARRWLSARRVL